VEIELDVEMKMDGCRWRFIVGVSVEDNVRYDLNHPNRIGNEMVQTAFI